MKQYCNMLYSIGIKCARWQFFWHILCCNQGSAIGLSPRMFFIANHMAKIYETANRNLEKVIALSSEMLELADLGDNFRPDNGCGIVFGTMRDSAYKIRKLAKEELARHESKR